jgi:hypothetical protein
MKTYISESYVEDIDALSWVLRDPAGMFYLSLFATMS